jgi:hypothetical protein
MASACLFSSPRILAAGSDTKNRADFGLLSYVLRRQR